MYLRTAGGLCIGGKGKRTMTDVACFCGCCAAGLEDIGVEARAGVYRTSDSRRTIRLDLVRSMRPMILDMGLIGERELDELDEAVRAHLDDPRTLVLPHLTFLVWGRKPDLTALITVRVGCPPSGGRSVTLGAVNVTVPTAIERLLTADVAQEIARAFGDRPIYPERVLIDGPDHPSLPGPQRPERRFPGWPGPVLVLSDENQGVCSWGVPLDGHQVLVGGAATRGTSAYAASVEEFIAARRWDYQCASSDLCMTAKAAELDQGSLRYLQQRLASTVTTAGWPGLRQYRFEHCDQRVMLWCDAGQCDWLISAASEVSLKALAAEVLGLSNLREVLWADNASSRRLLDELRASAPSW